MPGLLRAFWLCVKCWLHELDFQALAHAFGDALEHLDAQVRLRVFESLVGLLGHAHFAGDGCLWHLAASCGHLERNSEFRVNVDAVEFLLLVGLCLAFRQRVAVEYVFEGEFHCLFCVGKSFFKGVALRSLCKHASVPQVGHFFYGISPFDGLFYFFIKMY